MTTLSDPVNAAPEFVDYYAQASLSPATQERFQRVMDKIIALRRRRGAGNKTLRILDVGCGAGTQALLWAAAGHQVTGLDISQPLIELARQRAQGKNLAIEFLTGSATELPCPSCSYDVVLLPELLEHVPDWQSCVDEAARTLKPGGILFLSTTNRLCPVQQEYELPLYSWYPGFIKRRCERLAVTTKRHWVEYASFPAIHWFSFYQLRDYLGANNFQSLDRLDMIDSQGAVFKRWLLGLTKSMAPLHFLAQVLTPHTTLFAIKLNSSACLHR